MKIGLALGSGGARGWAHIGALQALKRAGIKPYCVAGTSMGALVGGIYVSGRLDDFEHLALSLDAKGMLQYFMEFAFPRSGLIDGKKIEKLLRGYIVAKKFEDMALPFGAMATDLQTGKEKVLRRGDPVGAIRASIAIPGIFTPVLKSGCVLVDGGLVNPLPVSLARAMGAEYVIAVDVNSKPDQLSIREKRAPAFYREKTENENKFLQKINQKLSELDVATRRNLQKWFPHNGLPSIFDVLGNSIRIIERELTSIRLKTDPPDLLIQPEVGHYNFMDFYKAREAIEEGVRAAREKLPDLKMSLR